MVSEFFDTSKATIIGSRVEYRSYSGDRFPKSKLQKNLFVNFAHGSRGLGTAILGANLIMDLVLARPLCIERSLFFELHPARFLIRKLKKRLKV